MKLIGSLTSPFVRKVRVVMAEKKLEHELIIDNVWVPDNIIQNHNPLGQIPCLIMDDSSTLFDSRVIVEYLDTLSPVGRLIPQNGRERVAVKCWEATADGILTAAVNIFIENNHREEHQRSQDFIQRQELKIVNAVKSMHEWLGDQSYCMGVNLSLADIAVGCALGYLDLRFAHIDWRAGHDNLAKLYAKLAERPSFINTQAPA